MAKKEEGPDLLDKFLGSWFGKILLFLLFAPFALIYVYGFFFGEPPKMGKFFGIWFMASLTAAAFITTTEEASGIWKQNKRVEWGCLLPLMLETVWFGYVLFKELGFFK